MDHAHLWPFPWLSPRHLVTIANFVLLPVLQSVSGVLVYCALQRWQKGPKAQLHVDPDRWNQLALTVLLPLLVIQSAARWCGMPRASLALESNIWLAWIGFGGGIATVCLMAWLSMSRLRRAISETHRFGIGAAAGLLSVGCWALIVSFQLDPGAWLETRTLRFAVQPPNILPIISLHMLSTFGLGAAIVVSASARNHRRWPRAIAAITSAIGCVFLVVAPWWLTGPLVFAQQQLDQQSAGTWSTRWTLVTLFSLALCAVLSRLHSSILDPRALLVTSLVAATCSQGIWASHRGPWAIRGWMYENGFNVEQVRTHRRSSALAIQSPLSGNRGSRLFRQQCATCHAISGPMSNWRSGLGCNTVEIQKRLEVLREADRLGHPDRDRMPPLVGSNAEIEALANWIRDRIECQ